MSHSDDLQPFAPLKPSTGFTVLLLLVNSHMLKMQASSQACLYSVLCITASLDQIKYCNYPVKLWLENEES